MAKRQRTLLDCFGARATSLKSQRLQRTEDERDQTLLIPPFSHAYFQFYNLHHSLQLIAALAAAVESMAKRAARSLAKILFSSRAYQKTVIM